jgi:hypothetical protein
MAWARWQGSKELREKADGSYALRYVYVEDDGSARELEPDEIDYLNTEFLPSDGGRPYVKGRYRTLTADGRIGGFLLTRKLPGGMRVKTIAEATPVATADAAIIIARSSFVDWLGPKGAAPDEPLTVAQAGDHWRVTGVWAAAGGGLFVDISAASGRVMGRGVTSTPRTFTLPLAETGARPTEHHI